MNEGAIARGEYTLPTGEIGIGRERMISALDEVVRPRADLERLLPPRHPFKVTSAGLGIYAISPVGMMGRQ